MEQNRKYYKQIEANEKAYNKIKKHIINEYYYNQTTSFNQNELNEKLKVTAFQTKEILTLLENKKMIERNKEIKEEFKISYEGILFLDSQLKENKSYSMITITVLLLLIGFFIFNFSAKAFGKYTLIVNIVLACTITVLVFMITDSRRNPNKIKRSMKSILISLINKLDD